MVSGRILTLTLEETAAGAVEALKNRDLAEIKSVDAALHAGFTRALATPSVAEELINTLFEITESAEARDISEPAELRDYLNRWEHLSELLAMLQCSDEVNARAVQLIQPGEEADQLLNMLEAAGSSGIVGEELMGRTGLARDRVSMLLDDLEHKDLIEYHEFRGTLRIRLGLSGQLLQSKRGVPSGKGTVVTARPLMVGGSSSLGDAGEFLKAAAYWLQKHPEVFRSLVDKVLLEAVPGVDAMEVVRLANQDVWPDWTIPRLPSLYGCIDRGRRHFLLWKLPHDFIRSAGIAVKEEYLWCNGNLVVVSVPAENERLIEGVAKIYEEKRATVSFSEDLSAVDIEAKREVEKRFPYRPEFKRARSRQMNAYMYGRALGAYPGGGM